MELIRDTKGLVDWGRVDDIAKKYPEIKTFNEAVRASDGVVFRAGDWVKLNDGSKRRIVAFDRYSYPLPVELLGSPKCVFDHNGFEYRVWDSKNKEIIRAIFSGVPHYSFWDLDEYVWLKQPAVA